MMDIYISGEITRESDVIAKLQTSEPVTIHINSGGGDPFAAIAISHAIRNFKGDIQIRVEGLCASAAVLLLCSGRKVISAFNSLFMIHSPGVMLSDSYDKEELAKIQTSLEKVEEIIKSTLETRLKEVELKEQWFTAQEALEMGLIDEIDSAQIEMHVDAKQGLIFANKCFFQMKVPAAKVTESGLREQIRAEELSRIGELQKMKSENAAVNKVLDVAIIKGHTVEDVKEYVAALSKIDTLKDAFKDLLTDQKASGAAGVKGSFTADKEERIRNIAAIANGLI